MHTLNKTISCFANIKTANNPKPVNLLQWLQSEKYANKLNQIRLATDKEQIKRLKSNLPVITPSGLFSYRKEEALIEHSGLIQFDIDFSDNQHITNYDFLKYELCKIVNVAYVGLSVSGKGYWGLIPITDKDNHKAHFKAILRDFSKIGIVIDPAPGNVCSGRIYAFDPDGWFTQNPVPYSKVFKERIQNNKSFNNYKVDDDVENKVLWLIKRIQQQRTDITGSYGQWFQIGCSLAKEFGESGRQLFHNVSRYHLNYTVGETDKQFNHCLHHSYSYNIGTFMYFCHINTIF